MTSPTASSRKQRVLLHPHRSRGARSTIAMRRQIAGKAYRTMSKRASGKMPVPTPTWHRDGVAFLAILSAPRTTSQAGHGCRIARPPLLVPTVGGSRHVPYTDDPDRTRPAVFILAEIDTWSRSLGSDLYRGRLLTTGQVAYRGSGRLVMRRTKLPCSPIGGCARLRAGSNHWCIRPPKRTRTLHPDHLGNVRRDEFIVRRPIRGIF